jgi:hypothetical protein
MIYRKLIPMSLIVAVACGLFASGAGAAIGTTKSQWEIGTTPITTPQARVCSKRGASNLVLKGTVLGAETEITATGLSCPESTIFNTVVSGENMATAGGKLTLTGVKVSKPAGCGISETITTESLLTTLHMELSTPNIYFTLHAATEGGNIVSVKITGCAIAGTYPVKGVGVGRFANQTGVLAKNQPLIFDATSNAFGSLNLAGKPATVTGEANSELVSGSEFRVTEK